jgi:TolB-like protein
MTGWVLSTCAALAIIPTTNRDRALPARPLRGDKPSIRDVKITPAELAEARKATSCCKRIAVLSFIAPAGDADLAAIARSVTTALTSDLKYVSGLIVLERSEGSAVPWATANSVMPTALAAMGRTIGADYVVGGAVARRGGDLALSALLVDASSAAVIARAAEAGPKTSLFTLADAALLALLPKELAPDPSRKEEISKVATTNQAAFSLYDEAVGMVNQMGGVYEGDGQERASKALDLLESAIKLDPKYLRAALLKAGCLARLGKKEALKDCLKLAHRTRVPANRFDELTRLELDGDYYVFVKGEMPKAVEQYKRMLAIDPNHLHALWMLTAIHAGEFEPSDWPGCDLNKAGIYAARLVAAHPGSAPAKFLEGSKP